MPPVSLHPLLPWWLSVALGGVVALGCLLRVVLPRGTSRAMWAGRILLVAALVVLALRPAVPAPARMADPIDVDVLLVLDTTTSMAAADGDEAAARRLDVATADLAGVVDAFAGARFAHNAAPAATRIAAIDPAREARQVDRLRRLAEDAGLDPVFAEKFLAFIVEEVIRHHVEAAETRARS